MDTLTPATTTQDLADQVHDVLAGVVPDDAVSGFTIHRHLADGTAAVTYRPGCAPAYTAVLRWTLTTWARLLRGAGFVVEVDACDDRGQADVPQVLRVLSRPGIVPPPETHRPIRERRTMADRAFPALSRDIAEQVIRRHVTDGTPVRLIEAAIDERGPSLTRDVLRDAVLDAIGTATITVTWPISSAVS